MNDETIIRPIIELYNNKGIGLIIAHLSGVLYTNQVGGYACLHPEIEGVFTPLEDDFGKLEYKLSNYFVGPKWKGWCYQGIDAETADFIDKHLHSWKPTSRLSVDRAKLKESCEAWIWVKIDSNDFVKTPNGIYESDFRGFDSKSGILTWQNSD